jgi:hypothetical protein
MGPQDFLTRYIKEQRGKKFALGKHDCLTFTNGAWAAMRGKGYADEVIGKYAGLSPKAAARLMMDHFGSSDLIAALDANLKRVTGFPPKGALVVMKADRQYFTGYAFGVALGVRAVFVGAEDVVYVPISQIEGAWV